MTPSMNPMHRWIGIVFILLLSAGYYSLYLNVGFNSTDDGNYAQVAYELLLGRDPASLLLSYGVSWFKLGEGLFRLFGVHFILVRALFFACITATNVVVFLLLARVSGRVWFAALMTSAILIVPAFPATAFYGLCVALNAATQIRLAARLPAVSRWDAALAGAAIGITFQVRPDFGFIFAAPLVVLLLMAPGKARLTAALAALAGAGAAALPFILCAAAGGYLAPLVRQYIEYPLALIESLVKGLQGHNGMSVDLSAPQRPGLEHPARAALVYAPIGFIALCALSAAAALRSGEHRGQIGQLMVALVAGLAAFLHYFLFRPDLSHLANFMPGFVIMTGIFLSHAWRVPAWRTGAAFALAAYLGLYVWIGLRVPGTGSIQVLDGRTEMFRAENGVDVRVAPEERRQLELVRDTIESHSSPGNAIVCLPYCPGFAFMTGRRMLLPTFYADEKFLSIRPTWLADAIALTRSAHPPVVIVADWAINGTERSRIANWAAAYVAAVDALARDRIRDVGLTIYLLNDSNDAGK